jgi:hypothetical protein
LGAVKIYFAFFEKSLNIQQRAILLELVFVWLAYGLARRLEE